MKIFIFFVTNKMRLGTKKKIKLLTIVGRRIKYSII